MRNTIVYSNVPFSRECAHPAERCTKLFRFTWSNPTVAARSAASSAAFAPRVPLVAALWLRAAPEVGTRAVPKYGSRPPRGPALAMRPPLACRPTPAIFGIPPLECGIGPLAVAASASAVAPVAFFAN